MCNIALPCRSHEIELFELKQQPVVLDYDEFEAVILVLAYHMYHAQKRTEPSFEEYLGEVRCTLYWSTSCNCDYMFMIEWAWNIVTLWLRWLSKLDLYVYFKTGRNIMIRAQTLMG